MNNLIAMLEAAPTGCRELDEAIGRLNGYKDGVDIGKSPNYTTLFDAALTWMPEGCVIELCQSCPARADDTWWDAYVFKRPRDHDSEPIGATDEGVSTPAHAACIAIAKAYKTMYEAQ